MGANLDFDVGNSLFFDRSCMFMLQQELLGQAHKGICRDMQYSVGAGVLGYRRSIVYPGFDGQRPDKR